MNTDSVLRDSLRRELAAELRKDADSICPECIDNQIDTLCMLEGIHPPVLRDEQMDAAISRIRIRAARKRYHQIQEARSFRRLRGFRRAAAAACFLVLFAFSLNYALARITGICLPAKAGIRICCGKVYCPCNVEKEKQTAGHE